MPEVTAGGGAARARQRARQRTAEGPRARATGRGPATDRPRHGRGPGRARRARSGARALLAAHWQFVIVIAAAAALRCVVMLGYRPILWYSDSYNYIANAVSRIPDVVRSSGYPLFLFVLLPFRSLTLVAALQALMGLGMGAVIYAVLRHRGLPWWGATLPALPVLFDVYEMQLEHMVMSDVLFIFLITVALAAAVLVGPAAGRGVRRCRADDRLRGARPVGGGAAADHRGGGPAAAPGQLETRRAAAGGGHPADRRLHGLVPRFLRAVRPGRLGRHVPVQPGEQLRRVLEDAPPAAAHGAVRPAAARPAARARRNTCGRPRRRCSRSATTTSSPSTPTASRAGSPRTPSCRSRWRTPRSC